MQTLVSVHLVAGSGRIVIGASDGGTVLLTVAGPIVHLPAGGAADAGLLPAGAARLRGG